MTIPIEFLMLPFFAFLCYWPCINGPFLFDDRDAILHNESVTSGNWRLVFRSPWRGLTLGTYALQCLWPKTSRSFHIVNVLIHAMNGWIMQRVVLTLGYDLVTSDFAAILYICLPFAANAVSYIAGRAAILSATFGLLGLWAILTGYPALAALALLWAIWAKEDGMAFIGLFAAVHLWLGSPWFWLWIVIPLILIMAPRRKWMPAFLYSIHWKCIRSLIRNDGHRNMMRAGLPGNLTQPDHAWTVFVETLSMFPRWMFGVSQSPYQGSGIPASGRFARILSVLAVIMGIELFFLYPSFQIPLLLVAIGPWMLYMAIPCPDQLIEYRYYSCLAGITLLFTMMLAEAPSLVWAVVIGLMASLTAWQAHAWSSGVQFWTASIYRGRGEKSRSWQELGAEHKNAGRLVEAEAAFRKAIELNPNLAPAMRNLAWMWVQQNKMDDALAMMKNCTHRCPNHPSAWEEYGYMLEINKMFGEAEIAFRRALFLDPSAPLAEQRLGLILFAREAYPLAEERFRRRFDAAPTLENRWNLMWTLRLSGKMDEAAELRKGLPPDVALNTEMVTPPRQHLKAVAE